MADTVSTVTLEKQIDEWRSYLRRRQAIRPVDVDELEDHLRGQVTGLLKAGLSADEAFLVAVKRIGALDELSREFAREHSERLWKQLLLAPDPEEATAKDRTETIVVLVLAVLAGAAIKAPVLFGLDLDGNESFYLRNIGFFALPLLAGYFAWKRGLSMATRGWIAAGFTATAVFTNVYPFVPEGSTEILSGLHAPMFLWFLIGVAYAGGLWHETARRMDFVRFSGELFIYYVLIALGGGVLTAFTIGLFESIGMESEETVASWLIPCGAMGAVLIGSWLVEAKQSVIENMAPVLQRLFTPLFTLMLLVFLATMAITGRGIAIEREILIAFDLLLVLVLGLLLYGVSARDPGAAPDAFDVMTIVLVISALLADALALAAITARISEFGFTPNRVAALGENVILLVNLSWSAWLYIGFMRGQRPYGALERWQMSYVPVYAIWAAIVVVAFPMIFGYI